MFFLTLLEVSFTKLLRWTAVPPDKTLTSRDMKQGFGAFAIVVLVCQSLCEQPRQHMAQNTHYVVARLTLYSRNKLPVVYQSLPVNSDTLDRKI